MDDRAWSDVAPSKQRVVRMMRSRDAFHQELEAFFLECADKLIEPFQKANAALSDLAAALQKMYEDVPIDDRDLMADES